MKRAIIAIAAVVLGGWVCEGRTITVDDDGAADFATIQAAIDDSNDGDTVLVADGTYTGDGNHEIDFHGKAITVRSENGPEHCIVDCTGGGKGFYIGKDFFVYGNEDANSILDGFTVSNGRGGNGGGIRCMGNPTILNCWIIGCSAGSTMSSNGGGISCDGFGFPIIKNCRIIGNTANTGGGISGGWGAIVVNCIISGNSAKWRGGGLEQVWSITHSTISGNTASEGGGVWMAAMGITNCKIIGNSATDEVGGVELSCQGEVTNCTFAGNRGPYESALSGCDYSSSAEVEITNCIFLDGIGLLWAEEATLSYNNVRGGGVHEGRYLYFPGEGNIDADPCFADPGYWDPNGTPDDADDDFWVEGDYHLKSQGGRWDANEGGWTTDDVTSPCIDAGDPNSPIGFELFPNGGLINMGAYGGTAEASKSWFGGPPCEVIVAGDVNGDCRVDFSDFAILALHWLESAPAAECLGLAVTDVKIYRCELIDGRFIAQEEVGKVTLGDAFTIYVEVTNSGSAMIETDNFYGWELAPENSVKLIGEPIGCAVWHRLQPGESMWKAPLCNSLAFEAEQAGWVTMSINAVAWYWKGSVRCEATFIFEILPTKSEANSNSISPKLKTR